MHKDFIKWHSLKSKVDNYEGTIPNFKSREVWWVSMGHNIGFEQDGKGCRFERPVLILKKYNKNFFLGIPLTSKEKVGKYYFLLQYNGVKSIAILSQVRALSGKRLLNKAGVVPIDMFKDLKRNFIKDILEEVSKI